MPEECPLGIVDIDGACNVRQCRNRDYCKEQTASWRLPWNYSYDKTLTACTVELLLEHQEYWDEVISEASGPYAEALDTTAHQEEGFIRRWLNEVHAAGWHSADVLPYKSVGKSGLVVDFELSEYGFYPAVELSNRPRFTDMEQWNTWDCPDFTVLIPKVGLNLD